MATYYVATTGNNSNAGTNASPWLTIAYAISRAVSGDIIHIVAGTYTITSQLILPLGITLEGDGATSIITSTSLTAEWTAILDLESSPLANGNQEIRNLKFDGHSLAAAQAMWITGRNNVKIHDCTFINFHYLAVYWAGLGGDEGGTPPTSYLTGSEFYNNTVTNSSYYGGGYARGALYIGGQDGMLIHDNTITQTGRAAGTNGWPLKMWGNGGWTKGLKVYNNTLFKDDNSVWDFCIEGNYQYGIEIYNNVITGTIDLNTNLKGSYTYGAHIYNNTIGVAAVGADPVAGITLEFAQDTVLIEKNNLQNCSPPLLFTPRAETVSNVTVQYNICPGVANIGGMYGIARFLGDNGWVLNGFYVYNNVFYGSTTHNPDYGIIMDSEGATYTASHISIINNIVVGFDTYWLDLSMASNTDYLDVENNIIYNCGNSNLPHYNGTPTHYTYLNNLPGSNPLVTSPTDFHLQAGSPAIAAGKNLGLSTDYAGNPVGNPPCIGAYEYTVIPPPVPAYVSSSIANATPTILTMVYSISLANIVPATSAFAVLVNGVVRTVNSVSITGLNVSLTLASAVVYGDVITVAYTKPGSNPLQTPAGGQAVSIGAQSVTNNINPPSVPAYVSSSVQNATPSLITMVYNLTLANIVPATSAFTVLVNSIARTVNTVTISGVNVQLTITGSIVYGDVITVAYTKPVSNPLQTPAGGQAISIGAQSVTNNVAAVSPVYASSSVQNATPTILTMVYNLSLANIVPATSAFSVLVNSVARNVNTVAISGVNVQLTLASAILYGDVVTVAYTKPVSNPLQTPSGGQAASITAQSVTNNVNPPPPTVPVYVNSIIQNATPTLLTMVYNLTLANIVPATSAFTVLVNGAGRAVSTITISGVNVQLILASPVVYGDVVTVAYTKPVSNPLQTPAGGQAISITAQAVANNVAAVNPVYASSSVQNATPTILTMVYNLTLANIVPATTAFSVLVNSVARNVNTVAISGVNVQLTLASAILYGDVVTVAYTKPVANPLQTPAGGQAVSITAQPVTNNVNPPAPTIPVYVNSAIQNATPTLLTMVYSLALANIVPATTVFTVLVNGIARTVNTVTISGTNVQLTLASAAVYGDVITVAYTKPIANPLQTPAGGQAASITAQAVANNIGITGPTYVSSVVENATPTILSMTYNMTLANIVPATSAFSVLVNKVTRTVNSVSISGAKVLLTLASRIYYGDVITISYTVPYTNPIQSPSGGLAINIVAGTVTNNVLATLPVYLSSSIQNVTPTLLTMVYSLSLANIVPSTRAFRVRVNNVTRNVTLVSIVDTNVLLTLSSPVAHGNTVTVSYTKPYWHQLQTPAGKQAASISSKPVTNNV